MSNTEKLVTCPACNGTGMETIPYQNAYPNTENMCPICKRTGEVSKGFYDKWVYGPGRLLGDIEKATT